MNFVAIDFETASEKRTSACSIGITLVESSKIVWQFQTLIRPKENIFKPMNIWVHGITADDVENEELFINIWPKIKSSIENNLVVAHNAKFDIEVLTETLNDYNLKLKKCNYICTVELSKKIYEGLPNNKLITLAEMLDIKFNHHNALDDSLVAAKVFLDMCNYLEMENINSLYEKTGISPGTVTNNLAIEPMNNINFKINKKKVSLLDKAPKDTGEFFKNKNIVFTGPLNSMSRAKASSKILACGGKTSNTINSTTDILITNISIENDYLTIKLRKVKELLKLNSAIKIINEEEFLKIITL